MGLFKRLFGSGRAGDDPEPSAELPPAEQSKQWFLRGVRMLDVERVDEALRSFDESIRLVPENVNAWHWKGVTLDVMERPAEALACFDRAIAVRPGDATFHLDRGKSLAKLGRSPEATASFQQFIRLADPAEHRELIAEAHESIRELRGAK